MSEEDVTSSEIAREIGRAMVEQAKNLADHGDPKAASAALRDLAEAYAWLIRPNQPH